MNKSELFQEIYNDLINKIHLLEDKPEETAETTLKALWITASGVPVSAEAAKKLNIPELTEAQINKLYQLINLRLDDIPLAHITRRQNFMGIEMLSDKRALIPRKETEILGRKALNLSVDIARSKGQINVIDVCCGSGNLGIAVAHLNPECIVYATDLSEDAVELAKENVDLLKLNNRIHVKQGDLLSAFESTDFFEKIDLIICNPPYILSSRVQKMDKEIASNEPALAFDGGMLGIKIIQRLISEAPGFLVSEGWLIFEVGLGQGEFIIKLCERSEFYKQIESVRDAAGNIRVIVARKAR